MFIKLELGRLRIPRAWGEAHREKVIARGSFGIGERVNFRVSLGFSSATFLVLRGQRQKLRYCPQF